MLQGVNNNIFRKPPEFKALFKLCISIFLLLVNKGVVAQDFPLSSINLMEKYHLNKSYAGISGNKILNIKIRQQWINIENSPKDFNASFYSPVYSLKGAAGVECAYQNLGAHSQYTLGLSYNNIINSLIGDFSFGIGSVYKGIVLDKEKIRTPQGFFENGVYDQYDDYLESLFGKSISSLKMQVFFLYLYDGIEIGMEFDKYINGLSSAGIYKKDIVKFNCQYQINYSEVLTFRLNGLIYSDFKVLQSDLGAAVIINKNYIAGLNFRGYGKSTLESLGLIGGADISKNIKLIYAYDIGMNSLARTHNGSHELRILVNLGQPVFKRKIPPMIFNPRLY